MRSFGQMYMQAGRSSALQPSHLSGLTYVGILAPPLQLRVVGPEDLEDLRAAEVIRHRPVLRQRLAQHGPADEQPVGRVVRARPPRRHAVALGAPERPIDLERLQL